MNKPIVTTTLKNYKNHPAFKTWVKYGEYTTIEIVLEDGEEIRIEPGKS